MLLMRPHVLLMARGELSVVVGNVDAGKSTLVGVLTGPVSFLDDGRGERMFYSFRSHAPS